LCRIKLLESSIKMGKLALWQVLHIPNAWYSEIPELNNFRFASIHFDSLWFDSVHFDSIRFREFEKFISYLLWFGSTESYQIQWISRKMRLLTRTRFGRTESRNIWKIIEIRFAFTLKLLVNFSHILGRSSLFLKTFYDFLF